MSFDYFSKNKVQYILTKLKLILDGKAVPSDIKNGTLTIQKNGTQVQTFSANQSNNATANITVPTKTSELTNDSGFITNAGVTGAKGNSETTYRTGNVNITAANIGLGNVGNFKAVSTVASQGLTDTEKSNARTNIGAGTSSFSGSYNDLSNKPTIPTVNNGTLTIQKNGTNVQTFTANQSGNATANITVPTKVSELTNDSGFTTNVGTITGIKMNGASKGTSGVVDLGTVITAHQDISGKADKSATVSTVAWDGTNKKITKTINGTTSDVVTAATILGNLTKAQVTTALGYTPPTSDTNTHRPIQVNGTEILGNNTTALNLKAGSNVSISNSSGTVTIAATDTNTWRGIQDNLTSDSTTESLSAKQGKNLANGSARDSTKLPLSGGQLTNVLTLYREGTTANNYPAQLKFKVKDTTTGQTYDSGYIAAYQDHRSTTYGTNMVVQSGGGMFLGSGEAPANHYAAKGASYSGEDTFITADGTLHLQSNGNNIANRKGFIVSTTGNLIPETADTIGNGIGGIGSSTNRVKDVYTQSINELLTGSGTAASDKGSSVSPRYFPAKWTFNIGRAPVDGDIITIKIPVAGHDYGVFVSINNGTNYHPVRVDYGTGRLTTHFGNGQYITLVYTPNATVNSVYAVAGADARSNITGCWTVLNFYNTNTDVRPSAYCDTAADTAAKVASCSGYNLLANSYIHVVIVNTNTYAGAITLNINGKGAKPIYINGTASSSSNYALTAGSYLVFYNGTNYYFRKDGKITTAGLVNTSNSDYALTDTKVTSADNHYNMIGQTTNINELFDYSVASYQAIGNISIKYDKKGHLTGASSLGFFEVPHFKAYISSWFSTISLAKYDGTICDVGYIDITEEADYALVCYNVSQSAANAADRTYIGFKPLNGSVTYSNASVFGNTIQNSYSSIIKLSDNNTRRKGRISFAVRSWVSGSTYSGEIKVIAFCVV